MAYLRASRLLAAAYLAAGLHLGAAGPGDHQNRSSLTPLPGTEPVAAAAPGPNGRLENLPPSGGAAPQPLEAPAAYSHDDKHKLKPGDRVSFQILEDRVFDEKAGPLALVVTDSGELDLPYLGRVNAAGKTCKQLADEVKALLEKEYYRRATVILGLDALAKVAGRVYVWGPVGIQGPIDIPANETFTAGKAILRAGGFRDFADKKNVKIVRKTPTGNVTLKVNMVEVLERGQMDKDVVLETEDLIIVPQRAFNF